MSKSGWSVLLFVLLSALVALIDISAVSRQAKTPDLDVVQSSRNVTAATQARRRILEVVHPELLGFETKDCFAGCSVKAETKNDVTYFAYVTQGSGVPILDAKCYAVDALGVVLDVGSYPGRVPVTSRGLADDVDPITCAGVNN